MAITGNLRTMQLSDLLQWLSMGQKTGTLVVRGSPGEKRIYFDKGRIISSSSTVVREYLGHFLEAYGYITEEELTRAMEVQEESKILLGKILVMIGAISEEDLSAILKLKAAETIYDIFLWTEGAFEFIDGVIPQLPMVPMSADVTGIVLEGLRRYDEWARIRTRIHSLQEMPAIVAPIDVETLTERDRLVLRAVDGLRSISEIAEATHNSDFFAASFIFQLLSQGKAEIVGIRAAGPDSTELTLDSPASMVFEEAQEAPFGPILPVGGEADIPPPPESPPPVSAAPSPPKTPPPASRPAAPPQPPKAVFAAAEPLQSSSRAMPAAAPPQPPPKAIPAAAPPQPPPAAAPGDFAKFLRRGPDSSAPDRSRADSDGSGSPSALSGPVTRTRTGDTPPARPAEARSESSRVRQAAIPVLNRPMEELVSYSFTPNEAFILSRVNGMWDVRSIAKISPFPETEVLRVFRKLEEGGVISWR